MRLLVPLLILFIFLPFSSASIEIVNKLDDVYNLGDSIDFSIKIIPDINVNALVKLTLKCTEKETSYYIVPVTLEKGKEKSLDAPSIKAFSEGLCNIRANLESLEGENIDGITSKEFTISNRLELSFTLDKTEVLPGDIIKIEGTANKKGNAVKDGSIIIILDNKEEQIKLDETKFSYKLKLDEHIKSGEHTIIVKVNDPYRNFNEENVKINVKAIPTTLEFNLNKKEFKPKETLQLTVNLLDQAGDAINEDVNLKLFKKKTLFKDETIIFEGKAEANKEFNFIFNYSTLPYDYVLKSSFGELEKEDIIKILPYQKIAMKIEGSIVFIKNVGNVEYNNEITILLEKEGKSYLVNKKIKLEVGEEIIIDLSKKVPSGNYAVTLPPETVTEEGTANVIKNVEIKDTRPLYKKGLGLITGGIIAGAGLLLSRPKLASSIVIIVILSIVCYYNRERIEKIIEKIREKRIKRF